MREGEAELFSEIEWYLNFKVLIKQLSIVLENDVDLFNRVLVRLDSFKEISELHNFLITTAKYMCASPSNKLQRGSITDLFFRTIGIKLSYMEFEDTRDCYFNFLHYIEEKEEDSDTFSFLDHNQVFSFSKIVRESLENVKRGNMDNLFKRIDEMEIGSKFKTDLKGVLEGSKNEYVQ